jgi:hypothetical protein
MDDEKARITALERKFRINSFPTLLVVDTTEREKGRQEGYNPRLRPLRRHRPPG